MILTYQKGTTREYRKRTEKSHFGYCCQEGEY